MSNYPLQNHNPEKHISLDNGLFPNTLSLPFSQSDLKRAGGITLIVVGIAGCIITSPLVILGGSLGYLTGLFFKKDTLDAGLSGAKIGSLGSISALLFGLELAKIAEEPEDAFSLQNEQTNAEPDFNATSLIPDNAKQPPDIENSFTPTEKTPLVYGTLFPNPTVTKTLSGVFKTTQAIKFDNQEEINEFISRVNALVFKEEAHIEQKKEESLSKVSELYIEILITSTKNTLSPEQEFWDRLEQMTDKDIKSFISKLSPVKEGQYKSSELDYLWRHFKKVEFEPLKIEQRKNKFAVMISSLSENQLQASFISPDFLNMMNQDAYIETLANTLNRNQLGLFASDRIRHETLSTMIKKLKPDVYLLGKLVAVMPYATPKVKTALIDQLAHLPYPASFNIELTRLAEYYIYNPLPAMDPNVSSRLGLQL